MAETKKPTKSSKKTAVKTAPRSAEEHKSVVLPAEEATTTPVEEKTTKAGKHSAKAIKEAEELKLKQERKASGPVAADDNKPKKSNAKPPRSRIERAGKKYRQLVKQIDSSKTYSLHEALALAVKTNPAKFDASVELHINLGVDPKQADQNVRDMVSLPAGTGKSQKIAVFAEAEDALKAKKAGADVAGIDEILEQLDKEQIKFDVLISMPVMMARLGKYAKVLGPRGLMPNPKSGTVTTDVVKAVTEAKGGRVEYRVDSTGIIHLSIGKVSFGADKLGQNADVVMASVRAAKPASLKNVYIKSVFVTTTMGPSVKVSL